MVEFSWNALNRERREPLAGFPLMAQDNADTQSPDLLAHGAEVLSRVTVDAYNAELRTPDGFVGDRAS
jgi:hypothetical protein